MIIEDSKLEKPVTVLKAKFVFYLGGKVGPLRFFRKDKLERDSRGVRRVMKKMLA